MTKTPESILASYDSTGTASVEDLAWALRSALRTVNSALAQLLTEAKSFIKEPP